MARNTIPNNAGQFVGLAVKMQQGLEVYGAVLGITQLPPDGFQDGIDAYVAAENGFGAARSARLAASENAQGAQDTLRDWLQVVRNILAGRFGNRWSTQWAQAGFINHSTKVPGRQQERMALALQLAIFFTANPTLQVTGMNVTASYAQACYDDAVQTQNAVAAAEVTLGNKAVLRNAAYEALLGKMRWLIKILDGALAKDDARWVAFGLNAPATRATPGQPQELAAGMNAAGEIVVQCAAEPLATRYRWRMRLVGAQADFALAARSVGPIATIAGVLPGQTVQLLVQAVNGDLQGVPSEVIDYTVPLATVAKARELRGSGEAEGVSAGVRKGQANGNGHGPGLAARAA